MLNIVYSPFDFDLTDAEVEKKQRIYSLQTAGTFRLWFIDYVSNRLQLQTTNYLPN